MITWMIYNLEKAMQNENVIEMPPYHAHALRSGILDMIEWASEDGMAWWEIYGVISGLEKYLELVMKTDLLTGVEDLEGCEDD